MKTLRLFVLILLCAVGLIFLPARIHSASSPSPLVLTGAIPLRGVTGRIDHFAFDPKNRLFVSALGNDSEEVIDLSAQKVVHSITGIPSPQGVAYSPETNKLFVASAKGKLFIYDGTSFAPIGTIDFRSDVDNLRYEASTKRVYVGYGDGEDAGISVIDATTNRRLREGYRLGAHPESFQLESAGPNIFVNVPELQQIAVINRDTRAVLRWPVTPKANFPMALDEADHRLFVATRNPPLTLVYDSASGKLVAAPTCVQDSDDLYYDAIRKRIYVTGGEGFITVLQQEDPNQYRLLARIPSALGARTAGYSGPIGKKGLDRLYVAVPARGNQGAEVRIYTVQD
ncbi:MAG TPA: YncE family protein [Candidatus Sulfotelmatobacter sp.]|nr:YncE family protein [Candidatus Sulfotelmatobacter sp.]